MTTTPGHKAFTVYMELREAEYQRMREYAGLLTTRGTIASYMRRAVLEQMQRDEQLAARVRATLRGETNGEQPLASPPPTE